MGQCLSKKKGRKNTLDSNRGTSDAMLSSIILLKNNQQQKPIGETPTLKLEVIKMEIKNEVESKREKKNVLVFFL